ncbi:MAG TPA: radical SAM protein [Candidatus Eremiobacteraceae bacterium]|nr:radical SAM protein [Candidatus Eremiobacteraceae bacterium]
MRFPIRLSASLFSAKIAGLITGASAAPSIYRLNPCVTHLTTRKRFEEDSTGLEWHSPAECAARARAIASPVVWLGGTDPLLHPEIGSVASAIAETGRFVFVHTSGYNLRQRIHEFCPDSRLFLALEFAGGEEIHNRAQASPDAFQRSIESIHAAKLSGFLVAAHVTVTAETDPCDFGQLIEFLDKKDVDGFIVTTGGSLSDAKAGSFQKVLEDSRALVRSSRWERFSALLETSYSGPAPALAGLISSGENAYEEGD